MFSAPDGPVQILQDDEIPEGHVDVLHLHKGTGERFRCGAYVRGRQRAFRKRLPTPGKRSHPGGCHDLAPPSGMGDPAVPDDDQVRDARDDLLNPVRNENHLRSLFHQFRDGRGQRYSAAGIQTGERLVQDQYLRRREQGAGDEELPYLPIG